MTGRRGHGSMEGRKGRYSIRIAHRLHPGHPKSPISVIRTTRQLFSGAVLRAVVEQVEQHGMILRYVREALPIALAEHCKDCLTDGGRLVIFTDSPAWASQLRFYAPAIRTRLKTACGGDFREIQVRNLRPETQSDRSRPMRAPSREIAHLIHASGLGSSGQLGDALLRLGVTMARYAGWK